MRRYPSILFAMMLLPLAGGAGTEEDTARFLSSFASSVADLKTLFSPFQQERRMELLSEPLLSRGVIIVEKPGKIRWETTEPYQSILIANNKSVAQFECMNGRWQKLNTGYAAAMKRVMDSVALIWGGDLAGQEKDYALAARFGDDTVLVMTPRRADLGEFVSSIEMHFEKDLTAAKSVILKEPNGDATVIRFLQQHVNVSLTPKCFDVDSPTPLDRIRQAIHDEN